jgi:hypothetical protein
MMSVYEQRRLMCDIGGLGFRRRSPILENKDMRPGVGLYPNLWQSDLPL